MRQTEGLAASDKLASVATNTWNGCQLHLNLRFDSPDRHMRIYVCIYVIYKKKETRLTNYRYHTNEKKNT